MVRFRNRGGRGEYERHLDTLDRINDQIMSKVVIAKVQAFRQMAIENLPDTVTQIDAATGEPEEVEIDYSDAFEATPGSMWRLPEGAKIWESTPTDLGPLRLSIKDDLENLAAVTQTALPAITPDAASGSAEGASLMREEHVGAVEACMDYAEVGWAEVMSTAFAFMGDEERADITQIEPIWGRSNGSRWPSAPTPRRRRSPRCRGRRSRPTSGSTRRPRSPVSGSSTAPISCTSRPRPPPAGTARHLRDVPASERRQR
jgi:hypothetical protein